MKYIIVDEDHEVLDRFNDYSRAIDYLKMYYNLSGKKEKMFVYKLFSVAENKCKLFLNEV